MQWIILTLLSLILMSIFLLSVRAITKHKIKTELYVFYISLTGFVFYLVSLISSSTIPVIPFSFLGLVLLAAILNFYGDYLGFVAFERSPNIGYAIIVVRTFVIFTTLLSVFLFGSELTLQKGVGIIVLLFFSFLISKEKTHKGQAWLAQAIASSLIMTVFLLLLKYFTLHLEPVVYLTYIYFFVSMFYFIRLKRKKISLNVPKPVLITLAGFSSFLYDLVVNHAFRIAPNIGYVNAITSAAVVPVTIISHFFFKDHLTLTKLVGVLGAVGGMGLILV